MHSAVERLIVTIIFGARVYYFANESTSIPIDACFVGAISNGRGIGPRRTLFSLELNESRNKLPSEIHQHRSETVYYREHRVQHRRDAVRTPRNFLASSIPVDGIPSIIVTLNDPSSDSSWHDSPRNASTHGATAFVAIYSP